MHDTPPTFADILGLWSKTTDLARDTGLPVTRIYQWLNRNFVHPKYWPVLIDAARRVHSRTITPDELMEAAVAEETKRRRRRAARKALETKRANRERQQAETTENSAEAA
jgi:hypothetical protein